MKRAAERPAFQTRLLLTIKQRDEILFAARVLPGSEAARMFIPNLEQDLALFAYELDPDSKARAGDQQRRRGRPQNKAHRRLAASLASAFETILGRRPGIGRGTPYGKVLALCIAIVDGKNDPLPYAKHGVQAVRGEASIFSTYLVTREPKDTRDT